MNIAVTAIAKEMASNFGKYNNMTERERFIRINDKLDIDVETYIVSSVFEGVKEAREYLSSELSDI